DSKLHVDLWNEIRPEHLELRLEGFDHMAVIPRVREDPVLRLRFWQGGLNLANVTRDPAPAEPALKRHAVAGTRVDGEVEAVPVLLLAAVVVRERHKVVNDIRLCRVDFVEPSEHLTGPWQSGIGGDRNTVWREFGRRDGLVVNDLEIPVPAPEVAKVHGNPGHNFALDARRELLAPEAIAPPRIGRRVNRHGGLAHLTKIRVADRTAVAVGIRVVQ